MKIVKKIAIVLLVVLIGMQFYRPEKNVSEGDYVAAFETETQPSPEVKEILKTAFGVQIYLIINRLKLGLKRVKKIL